MKNIMENPKVRKYFLIISVVTGVAVLDLWSKRWAEDNLATPNHLIPLFADSDYATVRDIIKHRFDDLSDTQLSGKIYKVKMGYEFSPEDKVFEIDQKIGDIIGFFAFDDGNLSKFARKLIRNQQFVMEKWLLKAKPSIDHAKAREIVRNELSEITLREYLSEELPHLNQEEIINTISNGLFPIFKDENKAGLNDPVARGDLYLIGEREIILINNHLDFSYAENPYGAWGILSNIDEGVRKFIFLLLSVAAMIVIIYVLIKPPSGNVVVLIALGSILGGAVGNVVDRLMLGYVVDFIHMYWGDYHWPRYNVADIGITIGALILLIFTSLKKQSPGSNTREKKSSK